MIAKGMGHVRAGAGAEGQLMAHTKYLLYRGKGPGEPQRALFGAEGEVGNRHQAVREIAQHFGKGIAYHKLVISPSDAERARLDARGMEGWQEMTRTVMEDLGARTGKELHWVATKHANTEHPHVHVIVAGLGETQAGHSGTARVRGQHRELQLRSGDFRQMELTGRRASGMRDRPVVREQLRLFAEQDRAEQGRLHPAREHEHSQEHEHER